MDACRFASVSGEGDLLLYKNNTDNKGASTAHTRTTWYAGRRPSGTSCAT